MVEESMWGEVPQSGKGIKLPFDYLREQAIILSEMYAHNLIGNVTQDVSSSGKVSIDFDIRVPPLGSYSYSLLKVVHGLDIYPLMIYGLANKTEYKCVDEKEFKHDLRELLSSPQVKKVIENILTLIKK
ncbi:MAG: hypothetical protein KAW56_04295 [Candidatus Marinimicrobia bacterium]|nr:hypothetical protein [Candidatus Neomarinimicrobiota bacterium]